MRMRIFIFTVFMFSTVVLIADPFKAAPPDDWIGRMVADHSMIVDSKAMARVAVSSSIDDWIERMSVIRSSVSNASEIKRAFILTRAGNSADPMSASRVAQSASPKDLLQIHQLEAAFNEAGSTKDLDMMMSLFSKDATFISDGKTYAGIDEIRDYWAHSGPFQPNNHWASYSPAYKLRISVGLGMAILHFECLWVDVATSRVEAHSYSNGVLERAGDRWVIKEMSAGDATQI